MFILYLLTSAVVWLAFRVVARMIDRVRLKDFDHQVGAVFGLAKGVVYCVVITFFAVTISEDTRQTVLHSRSGYYIAVLTRNAEPVLPKEIREVVGKYIDELQRKLNPKAAPTQPLFAPPLSPPPAVPAPRKTAWGAWFPRPRDGEHGRGAAGGKLRISRGLRGIRPNIRNIIGRCRGP